ncbi:CutC family protein [Rhizodiscina lignyota]|uniref:Copper homeostasis protein cutC homolog n=1 Tax=Rhizodiscina lignyota TaxID=1504668 RepID=A0A9P4M4Z3_9PEZI|nr:CutC family protein [Rhizodiscina lignyota]
MLEIACFSREAALIAKSAGADRIEFCARYDLGGLTPAFDDVSFLHSDLHIPLFVMIRPRGGDFTYTDQELRHMQQDIVHFKSVADGFVFGILTPEKEIDGEKCKALVELAAPKPCTFHRAIDETNNLEKSIESIAACGFKNVLTSGGKSSAIEGAETLKRLVIKGHENNLEVMPGGGVRSSNISQLRERTDATWFHSAAILEGGLPSSDEIKTMLSSFLT